MGAKITQNQFLSTAKALLGEGYDFSLTTYKNIRTKVKIICTQHGSFLISPELILRKGKGCAICDKISGKFPKRELSNKQYILLANQLHSNKYNYDNSDLSREKIEILCPIHGSFYTRKSAHISPSQLYGCHKCGVRYSEGENKIRCWLEEKGIPFEAEKTFSDLKAINGTSCLRYDFFLPKMKLFIEFDGRHHFERVAYGSRQSVEKQTQYLKRVKFNDMVKNSYAAINNYAIIRIPYTNIEQIEKILEENIHVED